MLEHGCSSKAEGESFVLRVPDATYDVILGLKGYFKSLNELVLRINL